MSQLYKASICVADFYKKNRLFDENDLIANKDNCLASFRRLKQDLLGIGYDLSTDDVNHPEESSLVIFNDMPSHIPLKKNNQVYILLAVESEAVLPKNFDRNKYEYFDYVFTWYDDFIDDQKVFKINYSFVVEPQPLVDVGLRNGELCLVSNDKFSNHPNELYSERIKAIEFFEKNYPNQFDLYGLGWDHSIGGFNQINFVRDLKLNNLFSKLRLVAKKLGWKNMFTKKYTCFRGSLSPKIPALRQYKFNLCYENVCGINGYITEKIFDCFFSGCIPIYYGAPNISDWIPANCYIDKRDFKNYKELSEYIFGMTTDDMNEKITNAANFLRSEKMKPFTTEFFSETIVNVLKSKI